MKLNWLHSIACTMLASALASQLITWIPEDRRLWLPLIEGLYFVGGIFLGAQAWRKSG